VGGQRHTPAALPAGKIRYPLYRRLGGPQVRYGQVCKISPRTVQPVATILRSTVRESFTEFSFRESFRLVKSVILLRDTLSRACRPNVNVREISPLNAELNPICHLLALLAHHILHVSGMRVK